MSARQKQFSAALRCELWGVPQGVSLKSNPELAFPISEESFDALLAERTSELQSELKRSNVVIETLQKQIRGLEDQIEEMNRRAQLAAASR